MSKRVSAIEKLYKINDLDTRLPYRMEATAFHLQWEATLGPGQSDDRERANLSRGRPPNCRGMTGKETASLRGLSMSAFQKARREGRIPGPPLPGKPYDGHRCSLDGAMAQLDCAPKINAGATACRATNRISCRCVGVSAHGGDAP
jgi:hypothetical protein